MDSKFSRSMVLAFISAQNQAVIRRMVGALGRPAPESQQLLEELIGYSREIEIDLRWTDPASGTDARRLLQTYNNRFVYALYGAGNGTASTAREHQEYYTVTDGVPVARFNQDALSADDLLDRWWKGGSRPIQTRDDAHGERKRSMGDADYLSQVTGCSRADRNVYSAGAMRGAQTNSETRWGRPKGGSHPGAEFFSGGPQGPSQHFTAAAGGVSVLGAAPTIVAQDYATQSWISPTAQAWNAGAEDYQRVPLGNASAAADARIASRRLTRKAYSNLENGIPTYRFSMLKRHYDREEASAGLEGRELIAPARGWDMSGLHAQLDAKRKSRWGC